MLTLAKSMALQLVNSLQYQDTLREYYAMLDLQDVLTNKQKRFQSYCHWTRIFHLVVGATVFNGNATIPSATVVNGDTNSSGSDYDSSSDGYYSN